MNGWKFLGLRGIFWAEESQGVKKGLRREESSGCVGATAGFPASGPLRATLDKSTGSALLNNSVAFLGEEYTFQKISCEIWKRLINIRAS